MNKYICYLVLDINVMNTKNQIHSVLAKYLNMIYKYKIVLILE